MMHPPHTINKRITLNRCAHIALMVYSAGEWSTNVLQ